MEVYDTEMSEKKVASQELLEKVKVKGPGVCGQPSAFYQFPIIFTLRPRVRASSFEDVLK
jgi:hypothetical protein